MLNIPSNNVSLMGEGRDLVICRKQL